MIFVYISWGILAIIAISTFIHLKGYYKAKKHFSSPNDASS